MRGSKKKRRADARRQPQLFFPKTRRKVYIYLPAGLAERTTDGAHNSRGKYGRTRNADPDEMIGKWAGVHLLKS